MNNTSFPLVAKEASKKFLVPVGFLAFLWFVQIINAEIFGQSLSSLGILPRTSSGLSGILFAPFLHTGYNHIIANSFMVVLLSWIICFHSVRLWWKSLVFISLVGGFLTWMLGSSNYHVGASILIFGFWGTIFGIAYYGRKAFFIIASIVLLGSYGLSILMGLVPQPNVSLAGHLGGLIAGIACAKYLNYNNKTII